MQRRRQALLLITQSSSLWRIRGYRTFAPGVPLPVPALTGTLTLLVSPIVMRLGRGIWGYRISVRPITWHCWAGIRLVVGTQVARRYPIRTLWIGLNLLAYPGRVTWRIRMLPVAAIRAIMNRILQNTIRL